MKKTWCGFRFSFGIALVCCSFFPAAQPVALGDQVERHPRPALEIYLKKLGYVPIPLERGDQNNLLMEARLGGDKCRLLVDTGCTFTVLDPHIARKFKTLRERGIKLEDPDLGALEDPSIVLVDDLKLGPAQFTNQPAYVKPVKPTFGSLEDGIIGCDFFLRHFCLIDCANLRLYVRAEALKPEARNALEASLSQSGYHETRLQPTRALVLICETRINGGLAKLLVDTGSAYTILDDKLATRLNLDRFRSGTGLRGLGNIGTVAGFSTRPRSFEIKGLQIIPSGWTVGVAKLNNWKIGEKAHSLKIAEGTLGADVLAVSGALIDLREQKLWFEAAQADAQSGGKGSTAP